MNIGWAARREARAAERRATDVPHRARTTRKRHERHHGTLGEYLEGAWNEPDRGIWEVRGENREFTYPDVMAWVAFPRSIATVERFGVPGPAYSGAEEGRSIGKCALGNFPQAFSHESLVNTAHRHSGGARTAASGKPGQRGDPSDR